MQTHRAPFRKVMVPVDLAHAERLEKAVAAGTDLARHYGISLCSIGVTAETPTEVARSPREHAEKLEAFGARQAEAHNLEVETAAYASHDPAVELGQTLLKAARERGADLIVMASHLPGLPDHHFASTAGEIASHADMSVFVVR